MAWHLYSVVDHARVGPPARVEIDDDGKFRCSCPAFKWGPRRGVSCRHTEWAEQDIADTDTPIAVTSTEQAEARAVVTQILEAAGPVHQSIVEMMQRRGYVATAIFTAEQHEAMARVLAAYLRTLDRRPAGGTTAIRGTRMITLD